MGLTPRFTVVIVAHSRPEYLLRAFGAIRSLDAFRSLEGIIVSVDDAPATGAHCAAVADGWAGIVNCSVPARVARIPRRAGIVGNSVLALKAGFDSGAEYVLYVEEDAVLSPDAIEICEWMVRQGDQYLAYALSRGNVPGGHHPGKFSENNVHPCPYAWVLSRKQWPWVLQHWCQKTYTPVGWSFAMTYNARMSGKSRFLAPHLARVKNIGRYGTNGGEEEFQVLDSIPASDGAYHGPYEVTNRITEADCSAVDEWMRSEIDQTPNLQVDGWLTFGRPPELGR